jgi:hypothetical protein
MKLIKGLVFLLVIVLFDSCFDPPQFPSTPQIEYNNIVFIDGTGPAGFDSLVLTINFKDGDGDLGIDQNDLTYIKDPYNSTFFFQANNGHLDTISTTIVTGTSPNIQYHVLEMKPNGGKLVTIDTRKDPQYSFLPPLSCALYETSADRSTPDRQSSGRKILIPGFAAGSLEANTKIVDTFSGAGNQVYYQVFDTFLVQPNPNSYNIQVDFLLYDPTNPDADAGGYVFYDMKAAQCQDFSGRFPVLTANNNSLEGSLTYTMTSIGFRAAFSIKSMKLRVQIKDRALHKSNVIETPVFTLDKIRKG